MRTDRDFVFFSGGTGGHLTPALAVARALEDLGGGTVRPYFFTGARGGERALQEGAGRSFVELPLAQPRRVFPTVRFAAQAGSRFTSLRRYLAANRPRACFGLGGYLSLPGVTAARACGIPVFLLEQNMVPGRVNRLLAPLATCVCTSFPLPSRSMWTRRMVCTGNPVRDSFLRLRRDPGREGPRPRLKIVVLGGSQGARAINDAVARALPALVRFRERVHFVHAAGPAADSVARAYRRNGISAEVAPFFPAIAEKIAGADLALSRAGGSTIAELLVLGVPPVLVPFPHSRDDHQAANAAYVAEQGAGVVCSQETFDRGKVLTLVKQLLFDRDIWQARAACAYRLGRPDAARTVAALALRTVGESARGGIR